MPRFNLLAQNLDFQGGRGNPLQVGSMVMPLPPTTQAPS
ncbi:hypothetical protein LINGRAHAP2_LOCUS15021 [Linum grandiflorum]